MMGSSDSFKKFRNYQFTILFHETEFVYSFVCTDNVKATTFNLMEKNCEKIRENMW